MDTSVRELREMIRGLKRAAEDLAAAGEGIPAVSCNTARIRASVKMLELNICDLCDLEILDQ